MIIRISLIICTIFALFVSSFAQSTCQETVGQILRTTYESETLFTTRYYSVYLPPCYDHSNETYPVVYLLHGSNAHDTHWQQIGIVPELDRGIGRGEIPPMIVVMPFGSEEANRNEFGQGSWGRVFVDELMPLIESTYRIDTSRQAIGGISRGGFWAYHIALKNPTLFTRVGGHSAFFDVYHAEPAENPLFLIDSEPIESLVFWIDRGKDDFANVGLDRMANEMGDRDLSFQYVVHPEGQHSNAYWSSHVREYLQFYTADWQETAVAFFTPVPTVDVANSEGIVLFLPIVRFPSLLTTIGLDRLHRVAEGDYDPDLILSDIVVTQLQQNGVFVHPDTTIVTWDVLQNRLWTNRSAYSLMSIDSLTIRLRPLWVDDVPVIDRLDDYPFAFNGANPNFFPERLTRITMSGTTALTRNTTTALDENSIEWAGGAILPYVTTVDYFHTSNEVSVVENCGLATDAFAGPLSFCIKPEHFDLFAYLDVDIVELTGNHNNDYGFEAYIDTLDQFRVAGIQTVGGGETEAEARLPLILTAQGNSLAIVSCNFVGPYYALVNEDPNLLGGVRPGAASCDWDWLGRTLPVLASQHDALIISLQYWEFEDYVPTAQQRFDYRRLADLGADIVIGTAEHKPQIVEFHPTTRGDEVMLHFGLGNLFFDQDFWGNKRFFMDTLYIYDGDLKSVEIFPGIIEDLGRPRLMTLEERENFLHFMFVQQNGF